MQFGLLCKHIFFILNVLLEVTQQTVDICYFAENNGLLVTINL